MTQSWTDVSEAGLLTFDVRPSRNDGGKLWTAIYAILHLTAVTDLTGAERRPNIVLIVVDDLGYGELGCQGNTETPTPHIDSIAHRGVRFTQGYVTASFCSPSRAALLTGRYQSRYGYETNPVGAVNAEPHVGLPMQEQTLANRLQQHGYATALIGKWHLGGTAKYHPLRRGFDEFFGFLHEGHYYVPPPYAEVTTFLRRKALPDGQQGRWQSADAQLVLSTHMGTHEPAYDADNPLMRSSQPVSEWAYLTDEFAGQACDFIDRCQERPFFLYLAFNAVHSPMQAQHSYIDRFSQIEDIHRRIFAAMLSNLDDAVGRVLQRLKAPAAAGAQTLIFFLSDNGGPTQELTSSNHPLRGGKGELYEGGIRIPFLMQWTGRTLRNAVWEQPVSSLDILPTALAAAGIAIPQNIDGVNLMPFVTGEQTGLPHDAHDALVWRQGPRSAIRDGDWKLIVQPESPSRRIREAVELYNLRDDPEESINHVLTHPDIASSMRQELEHRFAIISSDAP